MEIYKCKYLAHESEEIIGFCLNQNCNNPTQYCYECLNTTHQEHFNDCIRFPKIITFMNENMQIYIQSKTLFKEISKQIVNSLEQIQKKMDQKITILENMTQQLLNKDYMAFKLKIHIIKEFYSKKKDNSIKQQIIQLNNVFDTIRNMVLEQNMKDDQFEIEEINQETEEKKQEKIIEAHRLLDEGVALYNLNKYQEAIECYEKAISINPKDANTWCNKGNALNDLNKYQEAIECYDKAISINHKYDKAFYNKGVALGNLNKYQEAIESYDKAISINHKDADTWYNKGNALNDLNKYQEAIESYDKAISINPKYDAALSQKGFALYKLKKYQDAILCYDKALSISITALRLQRKADSLFQLEKKQEAKEVYLTALQKGSNQKDYIQKQLSKL